MAKLMWCDFQGWIIKGIASVSWALGQLCMREASSLVLQALKHPYGGAHVERNHLSIELASLPWGIL